MVNTRKTVCVYGALRSGTTMLRLMLDSHPQLSCPGESDVIFKYLTLENDNWALDSEALRQDWLFKTSGMTLVEGTASDQIEALVTQTGKGRDWTVLVLHRDLVQALDVIPEMRIIHLLRDPRDVACSSIGMGWASNVYCGVSHWLDTEDGWSAAESRLDSCPQLEIRYERLVSAPQEELERICAFLHVPFDPAMLTYSQRTTYSKPDHRKANQWKGRLNPREIGLLEGRLGDRLPARGYALSGHPTIVPTPLGKLGLKLNNKLGIWNRRIRDHGVIDPVAVLVANRLKLPRLARRAQQRIEQRMIAGLK